jgi:hypothetical protein
MRKAHLRDLTRGRVHAVVDFVGPDQRLPVQLLQRSVEELTESLLIVARILDTDGDWFAQEFEPEKPEPEPADAGEIEELFAELERMEAERGIKRWEKAGAPVSAETAES